MNGLKNLMRYQRLNGNLMPTRKWLANNGRIYFYSTCILVAMAFHQALPLLASGNGSGIEKGYTLKQLERMVLESNPEVLAQRLEERQSKSDIVTAGLIPNPQLNLTGDILPTSIKKYNPQDKQYGASLQVPIELGAKRKYRIEKAKYASVVTRYQANDVIRLSILAVRLAYWDALLAKEELKISEENLKTYEQLVALNEIRFKTSMISATELSRSQVVRKQAELQADDARLGYSNALQSLLRAVGLNINLKLNDKLAPIEEPVAALNEVLKNAMENRPDLQALRISRKTLVANKSLQDANAFPTIAASADFTQSQREQYYGVSAQVPIPMFDRNQGEREKAKLQIIQLDKRIGLAELRIKSEVESAYHEYITRKSAVSKFQSDDKEAILAKAAEIKKAGEFAYKKGATSLIDYLDIIRTYSDIFKSYVEALAQYNKSISQLKAVEGLDISVK